MNENSVRPDGTGPNPDLDPLEARIRAVPFRPVPDAWRAGVLRLPGSAAVPRARDAVPPARSWWRDFLPGPWTWRVAMAAWALVLLLNWDAGRRGTVPVGTTPRLTLAEVRNHLALRRDVLAALADSREPDPRPSPPPRIPGPRSALESGSSRSLGRRRRRFLFRRPPIRSNP